MLVWCMCPGKDTWNTCPEHSCRMSWAGYVERVQDTPVPFSILPGLRGNRINRFRILFDFVINRFPILPGISRAIWLCFLFGHGSIIVNRSPIFLDLGGNRINRSPM